MDRILDYGSSDRRSTRLEGTNASIAQWIVHEPSKLVIAGSTPRRGTQIIWYKKDSTYQFK